MQLNCVDTACEALLANKVIALPTDTVYGLSTLVNQEAIENLINIKQRPKDKGFIVISANVSHLLHFIDLQNLTDEHLKQLYARHTRPTTWAAPVKREYRWLTGAFDSIAIRLCQHPVIEAITTKLDQAITSSSANLSGHNPIKNSHLIASTFGEQLGFVYHQETILDQPPSRLIELISGKVLRP